MRLSIYVTVLILFLCNDIGCCYIQGYNSLLNNVPFQSRFCKFQRLYVSNGVSTNTGFNQELQILVQKQNDIVMMDNRYIQERNISKTDYFVPIKQRLNSGVQFLPYIDNDSNNVSLDNEKSSIVSKKYAIMGLLWLIAMLSAVDRVAMSVALVPMTNEFGLTDTMKGSISSLFSVGYGLVIIPAGLAVANASPRIILSIGIAIWSIATLATTQAMSAITISSSGTAILTTTTLVPLLVARAMVGAGESFVLPAVQRLLSAWTEPNEKASALAVIVSGFQGGTILAYLASPMIMEAFGGWRSLFFVYGISGLLVMIPWLLVSSDSPQQQIHTMKSALSPPINTNIKQEQGVLQDSLKVFHDAPWIDILKSKGAWACVLAHCSRNWGLYNTLAWTPSFYYEEYGIGVKESALLSILPCIAGAAGGFIAGFSADKMLREQYPYFDGIAVVSDNTDEVKTNIRKLFQSIALFGSATSLGVLTLHIPNEAWVAQVCLTFSLGLLSFSAAGFDAAIQDKAASRWSGLLYSITTLPAVVAGTFGVWFTGVVLDATNQNWSFVFGITAGINVVGALAFLLLYDARREFD